MRMFQKYSSIFITITLCTFILVPSLVSAVDIGGETNGGITLQNPLGPTSTFTELLNKIIDFLIVIGGALVAIIVIVGGYQILFAAGDPQKFAAGKKTIIYAVVGYGIVWLSRGVVFLIQNVLQ